MLLLLRWRSAAAAAVVASRAAERNELLVLQRDPSKLKAGNVDVREEWDAVVDKVMHASPGLSWAERVHLVLSAPSTCSVWSRAARN